ncbi:hypothetical protein [Massilia pseudoviolaceinigra]|uniref:hypothetical protein n=1 Tax=Massilia pseudoviolaceinigra TaxID=3057165 RepID=UPI0027966F7A|nr:hypothetical protein [Massilia sp. CCM 9206]MDQ1921686.1 hypothetical protein [Massilia sp. CCM 9206]
MSDAPKTAPANEMIERFRLDKLRGAVAMAMPLVASLLRDAEHGGWLEDHDRYHHIAEVMQLLSEGLWEGVQP